MCFNDHMRRLFGFDEAVIFTGAINSLLQLSVKLYYDGRVCRILHCNYDVRLWHESKCFVFFDLLTCTQYILLTNLHSFIDVCFSIYIYIYLNGSDLLFSCITSKIHRTAVRNRSTCRALPINLSRLSFYFFLSFVRRSVHYIYYYY